ncbi:MAG: hypothetical protein Kow00121_15880 [Elainellaceae cyanobacterium]
MTHLHEQEPIRDTVETVEVNPSPTTDIPRNDIPRAGDVRTEEFKVNSDALLGKLKELLREANIRRIILKSEKGDILLDIPLTAGIVGGTVGVIFLPVVVAIAAVGALVARLTIVVEKKV